MPARTTWADHDTARRYERGMEQDVRAIRIRSHAAAAWIGEADRSSRGSGGQFPPGQFFAEAGIVIAVCLGFALLARILLAAV